jgi:hypothetical protein
MSGGTYQVGISRPQIYLQGRRHRRCYPYVCICRLPVSVGSLCSFRSIGSRIELLFFHLFERNLQPFPMELKWLAIGVLIRLVLLAMGSYIDENSVLPYTDIDYFVFTDAASYVSSGLSPYLRHTYRYTPLLAWILAISNGKVLFLASDLLVYLLLQKIRSSVRVYFPIYNHRISI